MDRPDHEDVDALAEGLFVAVGTLRRMARRAVGRLWPVRSLTATQLELVRVVRRLPGVSVADAAGELAVAPNTVSTLVSQLVEAGLLERSTDPDDRRIARLTLTPAASRRAEQWRDRRAAVAAGGLARLSAADRQVLARAIPIIAGLAEELDRTPQPTGGELGEAKGRSHD
jgi:DNA-binding MarR family transcriptional regulator